MWTGGLLGYCIIAGLVFIAAVGAPLPVSGALTAAGVLAATDRMDFPQLLLAAALGAIGGDIAGYALGRFGVRRFAAGAVARRDGVFARVTVLLTDSRSVSRAAAWTNAMLSTRGNMGAMLLLSRTVLAAFGPVVNVVSGMRRYPIRSFLLYDVIGEMIWASMYIGVGYLAGTQGNDAADVLTNPLFLVGMVAIGVMPLVISARIRPAPASVSAGD